MAYKYYYRFEGNANDSSGSNNGTWGWSSSYTQAAPRWQWANFTATSQYVFSWAVTWTSTGATYSAWCWINTSTTPAWQVRFWSGYNGSTVNTSLSIWIRASRWLVDRWDTGPAVTSTTQINDWKWHFVVWTRTSWGNKVLYIDWKQEASASVWSYETMNGLASYLNWYDTSINQKFTHKQTDSFFDDTALSAAKIKNLYAYWKGFY